LSGGAITPNNALLFDRPLERVVRRHYSALEHRTSMLLRLAAAKWSVTCASVRGGQLDCAEADEAAQLLEVTKQ
jgi:hypothetical protein